MDNTNNGSHSPFPSPTAHQSYSSMATQSDSAPTERQSEVSNESFRRFWAGVRNDYVSNPNNEGLAVIVEEGRG